MTENEKKRERFPGLAIADDAKTLKMRSRDRKQRCRKDENDSKLRSVDVDAETLFSNPGGRLSLLDLNFRSAVDVDIDEDEMVTQERVQRISSPERWELKQMREANCVDRIDLPNIGEDAESIVIEIVEETIPALLPSYLKLVTG